MKKPIISLASLALIAIVFIFFPMCTGSVEEAVLAADVVERVDIEVTGASDLDIHQESVQQDAATDLVVFEFNGPESNEMRFQVQLSTGYTLNIRLYNINPMTPSSQVGQPFNLHLTNDLSEYMRYVTFEVENDKNAEVPQFSGYVEGSNNVIMNAFTITEYDYFNKEVLCRINDVTLHNSYNSSETISIFGTFRGAITF